MFNDYLKKFHPDLLDERGILKKYNRMEMTFPHMDEEQVGIILLQLMPDLEKCGEFDKKDRYSNKFKCAAELKSRHRHYDELGIEKQKYEHLKQYKNARYVCFTPRGLWSFDIHKLPEPIWMEVDAPTSTYYKSIQLLEKCIKTWGTYHIKDGVDLTPLLFNHVINKMIMD